MVTRLWAQWEALTLGPTGALGTCLLLQLLTPPHSEVCPVSNPHVLEQRRHDPVCTWASAARPGTLLRALTQKVL